MALWMCGDVTLVLLDGKEFLFCAYSSHCEGVLICSVILRLKKNSDVGTWMEKKRQVD